MAIKVLGRCSNCGGNVIIHTNFMSIYPPKPMCDNCGATPANAQSERVIPMNPAPFKTLPSDDSFDVPGRSHSPRIWS